MQRVVNTTTRVGLAAVGALVWILTEGASLASATTRFRSGGLRTQLVGHYGGATAPTAAGLPPTGADVMSAIVALMAVLALAFLVVTFIRRRTVATG